MPKKDPWFVEERAYAFSGLLLTSRNDLFLHQQRGIDKGIDLLVEVLKSGKHAMRVFGVQLKGCISLPNSKEAIKAFSQIRKKSSVEMNLPLCAFLIDVKKNQGYSRWLVEPVVPMGEPRLMWNNDSEWQTLNEDALNTIVSQVTAWYDALRPDVNK